MPPIFRYQASADPPPLSPPPPPPPPEVVWFEANSASPISRKPKRLRLGSTIARVTQPINPKITIISTRTVVRRRSNPPRPPEFQPFDTTVPPVVTHPEGWESHAGRAHRVPPAPRQETELLFQPVVVTVFPEGWEAVSARPNVVTFRRVSDPDVLFQPPVIVTYPEGWQADSAIAPRVARPVSLNFAVESLTTAFAAQNFTILGWEAPSAVQVKPGIPRPSSPELVMLVPPPPPLSFPEGWQTLPAVRVPVAFRPPEPTPLLFPIPPPPPIPHGGLIDLVARPPRPRPPRVFDAEVVVSITPAFPFGWEAVSHVAPVPRQITRGRDATIALDLAQPVVWGWQDETPTAFRRIVRRPFVDDTGNLFVQVYTVDLLNGLGAYYRLDGDLQDSSGNGNHLGGLSDAYATGKLNQGLAAGQGFLNGVGAPFPLAKPVSLSAWFLMPTTNGDINVNVTDQFFNAFRVTAAKSGASLTLEWADETGSRFFETVAPGWHHLVWIVDTTYMRAYLDGALLGNSGPYPAYGSASNISIIALSPGGGVIDEVGVWGRAMNPAEVLALWNHGNGFDPTAIVARAGGLFRRFVSLWPRIWGRTESQMDRRFRRTDSLWSRIWRWKLMANTIPAKTLVKTVNEIRDYGFDFSNCPEVQAGATLTSAEILNPPVGLTFGAVRVNETFDGVAAFKVAVVEITGGTDNTTYPISCRGTLNSGKKLIVPGRLVVTGDAE